MCKIVEDYAKEIADKRDLDNINILIENGCSLEAIIATFKNVSEATIQKIYEEVVAKNNN